MSDRRFKVMERAAGGWRLCLLEDGAEVGGGAFPVTPKCSADRAYAEAVCAGMEWVQSVLVEPVKRGRERPHKC